MIRALAVAAIIVAILTGCNKDAPKTTVTKTVFPNGTETCVAHDGSGDPKRDWQMPACLQGGFFSNWTTTTVTATPTP